MILWHRRCGRSENNQIAADQCRRVALYSAHIGLEALTSSCRCLSLWHLLIKKQLSFPSRNTDGCNLRPLTPSVCVRLSLYGLNVEDELVYVLITFSVITYNSSLLHVVTENQNSKRTNPEYKYKQFNGVTVLFCYYYYQLLLLWVKMPLKMQYVGMNHPSNSYSKQIPPESPLAAANSSCLS